MVIRVFCECGVVVTATVAQMRKAQSPTSSDRRRVYATGASCIRHAKDPSAFRFASFTCDAAPVIHIITTTTHSPFSIDISQRRRVYCASASEDSIFVSSCAVQYGLQARAAPDLITLPVSRISERLPRYLPAADHENITRSKQEALKGDKLVAETGRFASWLRLADRKSFGS